MSIKFSSLALPIAFSKVEVDGRGMYVISILCFQISIGFTRQS